MNLIHFILVLAVFIPTMVYSRRRLPDDDEFDSQSAKLDLESRAAIKLKYVSSMQIMCLCGNIKSYLSLFTLVLNATGLHMIGIKVQKASRFSRSINVQHKQRLVVIVLFHGLLELRYVIVIQIAVVCH
jgi:hypothetical protein